MSGGHHDPIEAYLHQLRASLRVGPAEAELIVAEAEDHLRETTVAGRAAGLTEREAQEAAISAFGSVRAVVLAHETTPGNLLRGRTPAAVIGDVCLAAWKGGAIGLTAVGASGLVVFLMNATLGRAFTGQPPAGVTFGRDICGYWLAAWPGAHTCAQAAMLEASSDAVILRVIAGIFGVALLEAYVIARYLMRRRGRGPAVLLAGYFPALAACVFGSAAVALALAQLTGFTVTAGPGTYLSGVIVAAVIAVAYAAKARPVFRRLMRGFARYVRAR
jgi:HAAS domain-containing protein